MTTRDLRHELTHYIQRQDDFVREYDGKVVVLKGGELLRVYNSEAEALAKTRTAHVLGTFLIQRVSAGDRDYTATIPYIQVGPSNYSPTT